MKFKKVLSISLLLLLLIGCKQKTTTKPPFYNNDSLNKFMRVAYDNHEKYIARHQSNLKALGIVDGWKNDSLKRIFYRKIAVRFWSMSDYGLYKKLTAENLKLSKIVLDDQMVAKCYVDLGNYYAARKPDSTYYYYFLAEKLYYKLKDTSNIVKMLMVKSEPLIIARNFTKAEKDIYKSIKLLLKQKKQNHEQLFYCHNLLGNLYNNSKEYKLSLQNFDSALKHIPHIKKLKIHPKSLAYYNISIAYADTRQFKQAMTFVKKVIDDEEYYYDNPSMYMGALSNLCYCKLYTRDYSQLPHLLNRIIKESDSLHSWDSKQFSLSILGEYLAVKKDTLGALKCLYSSNSICRQKKIFKGLLYNLSKLIKIDRDKANIYFNEYERIKDSLAIIERQAPNKFARIEFETDNLIQQQKQLKAENARKDQKLITVACLLVIASLLIIVTYLLNRQRLKSRELKLIRQQRDANEEIYNLMLIQQKQLDKGKQQEKKRIAKELHDGVMGRLTGIRLNLFVLIRKRDDETADKCLAFIDDIQTVEKEIRGIAYGLSSTLDEETDYIAVVRNIFAGSEQHSGIHFELQSDETIDWQKIKGYIKMQLYRILQETIQNILKHANAKTVFICIDKDYETLQVAIHDDGVGFERKHINKGLGLINIKERTKELKGKLKILSTPNVGTTIKLIIPLIQNKKYENQNLND